MRFLYLNSDTGHYSLTADLDGDRIPKYAILSHTWGPDEEEVTFEDMINGTGRDKPGYKKISLCGEHTRRDGLKYFWVDTCCIDKRSSAVLSRVSTLYWPSDLGWGDLASIIPLDKKRDEPGGGPKWSISDLIPQVSKDGGYQAGDTHHDAYPINQENCHQPTHSNANVQKADPSLPKHLCRWFTRGWTLQELIAPKRVDFFGRDWRPRGRRSDASVVDDLSRITGISSILLSGNNTGNNLQNICFGQRMSWVAHRLTSRVEDIAYCLLGIFQISMPLLYGEGSKAFFRLQEEILKSSTDLSILAWTQSSTDDEMYRGIFSRHPYEFRALGECRLDESQFSTQDEIFMTNKGVQMKTSLFSPVDPSGKALPIVDVQFLSLGCYIDGGDDHLQGIFLKTMKGSFVRGSPDGWMRIDHQLRKGKLQQICLSRNLDETSLGKLNLDTLFGINMTLTEPDSYFLRVVHRTTDISMWFLLYLSARLDDGPMALQATEVVFRAHRCI